MAAHEQNEIRSAYVLTL